MELPPDTLAVRIQIRTIRGLPLGNNRSSVGGRFANQIYVRACEHALLFDCLVIAIGRLIWEEKWRSSVGIYSGHRRAWIQYLAAASWTNHELRIPHHAEMPQGPEALPRQRSVVENMTAYSRTRG